MDVSFIEEPHRLTIQDYFHLKLLDFLIVAGKIFSDYPTKAVVFLDCLLVGQDYHLSH